MKHRISYILIAMCCLVALATCNRAQQGESLTIAYVHEPPYSYVSAQGVASGLFPEAARKIAKELNYSDIKWVLMSFDNLLPALKNERVDMIASGMTTDPARSKVVCFSIPLVKSQSAALWPKYIDEFDPNMSLASQNITYAVVNGSIEAHYLKQKLGNHKLIEIEDAYVGLYSIAQKKAEVLLLTEPSLRHIANTYPDQYTVEKTQTLLDDTHQVGFAFNKHNKSLVKRWNKAQLALMQSPSFKETISSLSFSIPSADNTTVATCDVS